MLRSYRADLERDLARRLPGEEVQALLAETEALATFGRSEALPDVRHARFIVFRLWGLTTAVALLMASTALFLLTDWTWLALGPLAVAGFGSAWFVVQGFRAGRPAPVPLFWGGIGASLLNLRAYGGEHHVIRWHARETMLADMARPIRPGRTWTVRDPRGNPTTHQEASSGPIYDASDIDALTRVEANPIGNTLSQVGGAFSSGMALACGAALCDLVGAGLALLWGERHRRRTLA